MGVCQEQEKGETQEAQHPVQNMGDSILPPLTKCDVFFPFNSDICIEQRTTGSENNKKNPKQLQNHRQNL